MRSWLSGIIAFGAAVTLAYGHGEARFEAVLKEMLGTMEKVTTNLAGIRDEETAKAAQPELRKLAGQWQALIKKAEDVAPPNREEKTRLEEAYAGRFMEARKKLFGEVERVRGVAGGREALAEISAVIQRKSKQ